MTIEMLGHDSIETPGPKPVLNHLHKIQPGADTMSTTLLTDATTLPACQPDEAGKENRVSAQIGSPMDYVEDEDMKRFFDEHKLSFAHYLATLWVRCKHQLIDRRTQQQITLVEFENLCPRIRAIAALVSRMEEFSDNRKMPSGEEIGDLVWSEIRGQRNDEDVELYAREFLWPEYLLAVMTHGDRMQGKTLWRGQMWRTDSSSEIVHHDTSQVLIEGPGWSDAKFFGQWLLAAAQADLLWKEAIKTDAQFKKQTDTLEIPFCLNFDHEAVNFLSRLFYTFPAVTVALDDEDAHVFAALANMGFFVRTGERYQMVVPAALSQESVKAALLKLAQTEEDSMLHPEQILTGIPPSEAKKWRTQLANDDQDERIAIRHKLLS